MTRHTTPSRISPDISRLCAMVLPGAEPRYVEAAPIETTLRDECFDNVARQVVDFGGRRVIGWQLWEWPGIFAEAEFHAIWEKPDGSWLDISPKPDGETRTLFLPDPTRDHEHKWVANIKLPLAKGELVRDYIRLTDIGFEIVSNFNYTVNPTMTYYGMRLEEATLVVRHMLEKRRTTNSKCACRSNLTYGNCHRHYVKDTISALTNMLAALKKS